jgi:predicted nucleotidyltransferase
MLHLRMTRDETITLLRRYADDIRGFAVTGLYLFGSTARGEAGLRAMSISSSITTLKSLIS